MILLLDAAREASDISNYVCNTTNYGRIHFTSARGHGQVHVVDQESLFPVEEPRSAGAVNFSGGGALPTFNTNAIEAQLWRLQLMADGGPRPPPVFVHMNDDYIWLVRGQR